MLNHLRHGGLALAIAEIGARYPERRIALLMDKHMSQLPPFTVKNGGVNSGFMIAGHRRGAHRKRIKRWRTRTAWIACRHSANQEDHVSNGPGGGAATLKWRRIPASLPWVASAACRRIDLREG